MSTQKGSKERLCPGCGNGLKEVYAEASYGRYLILDQCQNCGGIWFDRWELYFLKDGEADRLDPVDSERLLTPLSFLKGPGLCPNCDVNLEPFQDPNLPEDARIEQCTGCNGLWLNRGELRRYKDYRTAKRKQNTPHRKGQAQSQECNQKNLETLQNLGKAISTKVNAGFDTSMALQEPGLDRSKLTKDLVFIILQVLLRMLLKI
ncbi:MAG: zf-TFIIB domain-containing protein [Deltaproteobacteria bacterium]|nr:zf-TFIIB domain-containing protein [Deltaproteobacteria bacterium]